MNLNIVAFTPIRLNNTRLPGKNIRPLGGVPLLNYAINTVDGLGIPNYIWCSERGVMNYVTSKKVIFAKRPGFLDGDSIPGEQIYTEFAKSVKADVYLLYHVTSPFVKQEYYKKAIEAIVNEGHDSAFSVYAEHTLVYYKSRPLNFSLEAALPGTQDLEPVLLLTSGFFAFQKKVILYQGRRIGKNPLPVEVDFEGSIDIGTEEDFRLAEVIVNK